MKQLLKLLALSVAVIITGNVFASTNYYGLPKKNLTSEAGTSYVVLHNYVVDYPYHNYDTFTAYAVFNNSGKQVFGDVGYYGSGTDVITFEINWPDTQVCVDIYRKFDNAHVTYKGPICQYSGNINIGPYALANKLPMVKFVK